MTDLISGSGLGLYNSSVNAQTTSGSGVGGSGPTNQVYVNTSTGNLVVQQQDELLASLGINLGMVRTYNSQGTINGDNNDGWRIGVYRSLYNLTGTVNTAGSTITKDYGDGHEAVFTYDSSRGLYVSTDGSGAYDTLSYNGTSGQWTWTDGTPNSFETYDSSGKLLSASDANGNVTNYTYTGSLITQISTASGETVYLDYAGNNLSDIRTVTKQGTETDVYYGYDSLNRLTSVSVDLSPTDNSIADGNIYKTTYTYDGSSTRIASITNGDGNSVSFTYIETSDGLYRVATATDGLGAVTSYSYDLSTNTTTVTNALGQVSTYTYDSADRLISSTDPLGQTTSYGYDASGDLTSVTDALGRTTTMTYDSFGNLLSKQDAAGDTVTFTYDSNNRMVTQTNYAVPDPDGTGPAQPSDPLTTRYVYDANGNLRFTVSPQGRVVENQYNAAGERVSTITYAGGTYNLSGLGPDNSLTEAQLSSWAATQDLTKTEREDYTYDFRGNLTTATTYDAVNSDGTGNTTDGNQSIKTFVYDAHGNLVQTIDPRGNVSGGSGGYVTSYTYDGLGRLLSTNQWIDATHTRTTVTTYDDANNRVVTTLASGLTTTSAYDAAGNLLSTSQGNGSTVLGTTTYQYDAAGNLRVTTNPTGQKTQNLYDADGRLIATIDATGAMTEFQRDAVGNIVEQIQYVNPLSAAQLASLTDSQGNPVNVSLASVLPTADPANDRVTYTLYDQANRVAMTLSPSDTDPSQVYVTQNIYDGAGRLTDTIQYANPVSLTGLPIPLTTADIQVTASPASDRHVRYFYDSDGKRIAMLDAAGYLTEYQYDSAGQLIQTVSYANAVTSSTRNTDSLQSLESNIAGQGTNSNDQNSYSFYNDKGQVVASLDAGGYLTEYQYDLAGNTTVETRYYAKANTYTGTQTVAQLRPASLSAQITITSYNGANQVVSVVSLPQDIVTSYLYDNVGQLLSTTVASGTGDGTTTQSRYDLQGRVTQELSAVGSAALQNLLAQDPTASQSQIDAIWTSYSTSYSYDTAGRRIGSTDANGNTTLYFYDGDNRLVYTVNALGEVSQSVYNAFGEVTDSFRYSNRISTTGLTGGLVTADLQSRVSAIADPSGANADSHQQFSYTLRGTVKQSIDALGNTTNNEYDAFGELMTQQTPGESGGSVFTGYSYDQRGLRTSTYQDILGVDRHTSAQYDAFGRVVLSTDGNGNQTAFNYDALGRTITTTTAYGTSLASSVTQTYDAFGRVLTRTDALGNTTTYTYHDVANANGDTSFSIITPDGVKTTTTTNAHGETVAVADGNGNTTSYAYNADGDLVSTTDPLNNVTHNVYDRADRKIESIDANGVVTSYVYDAANRILTTTVDPKSIHSLDDNPNGLNLVTTNTYNGQGRILTTTDPNGIVTLTQYDAKGQVTQVTVDPTSYVNGAGATITNPSGLNLVTTYTYDASGHSLTVTRGAGTASATTTQYVYDNLGRRTAQIVDPSGLKITTDYVYDKNDNVVATIEGVGTASARTTRNVYDANNRLIYTIDALGGVTQNTYDANGNLLSATQYANPISLSGLGNAVSQAQISASLVPDAGADHTTSYAYDAEGRLVFTRDALGGLRQKFYDAVGNVIKTVAYAGTIPAATANDLASLTAAAQAIANQTTDHVSRTVYDAAGRVSYSIDALGDVTGYTYDNAGHTIATTQYATSLSASVLGQIDSTETSNPGGVPALVQSNLVSTSSDRTTIDVYDAAGRVQYTIDALGDVTRNVYDANGNITQSTSYSSVLNSAAVLAAAGYSASQIASLSPAQIEALLPTLLNGQTVAAGLTPNALTDQTTRTFYDAAGRVIQSTDAAGNSEYYSYDAVGNRLTLTNKEGAYAGDPAYTWTYQYDKAGNLLDEITPPVSVTSLTQNADGSITPVTTQEPVVTVMTYDAFGNVTSRTEAYGTPNARTTTYVYDALGHQIQTIYPATNVYNAAADSQNNGVVSTQSPNVMDYAWVRDPGSNTLVPTSTGVSMQVDPTLYGDNTPTSVQATVYDSNGNLIGTTTTDVGYATSAGSYSTWTSVSNWNGQVNLSQTPLAAGSYRVVLTIQDTAVASYSAAGQLVDGKDGTWSDSETINVNVGTVYGAVARTESTVTPVDTVTVDRFGNAVVDKDVAGNYSYKVYDSVGRLQYAIDAMGYVTQYSYDNFGNQTSTTRYATALDLGSRSNPAAPFSAQEVANMLSSQTASQHAQDRTLTDQYDQLNRSIEVVQPQAFAFDSNAVSGSQTFTAGATTQNTYDAFGDLISQSNLINPLTNNWSTSYSYYDQAGRVVAQVDALGYLTTSQYDAHGNLIQQTQYAQALAAGSWDASGYGTVTATVATSASSQSAIGFDRTTTYAYDTLNRKIAQTQVGVIYSDPTYTTSVTPDNVLGNLTTTYGYDALGNLISTTDPTGATSYTYYDVLGHVVAQASPTTVTSESGGVVNMPAVQVSSHGATWTTSNPSVVDQPVWVDGGETGYTGYVDNYVWNGSAKVNLSWDSLQSYGSGNVTVTVDYSNLVVDSSTGAVSVSGSSEASQTFSNATADTGVSMITGAVGQVTRVRVWKLINGQNVLLFDQSAPAKSDRVSFVKPTNLAPGTTIGLSYAPVGSSNWTTASLATDGNLMYADLSGLPTDQYQYQLTYTYPNASTPYATGSGTFNYVGATNSGSVNAVGTVDYSTGSPRLLLNGNTAGITGITLADGTVLSAAALNGGELAIGLSSLPRGTYTYTVNGNTSAGGTFIVTQSTVAGPPVVQESQSKTIWSLAFANIPSGATAVSLQYRPQGSTGPYLTKSATDTNGVWSAYYDDIADGAYDYILSVTDSQGNTSSYSGSINILRGDSSNSIVTQHSTVTTVVTPLTVIQRDIFGNAVHQESFADGAGQATASGYTIAGLDPINDRNQYSFYDAYGNVIRSVDAMGQSIYSSYDVQNHVVKSWQSFTDASGALQDKIDTYTYDKNGNQIATSENTLASSNYLDVNTTPVTGSGNTITWAAPAGYGTTVTAVFRYRLLGSSQWLTLPINISNSTLSADVSGLTPGSYFYDIEYTHAQQTKPYSHAFGTFTANGTAVSVADGSLNFSNVVTNTPDSISGSIAASAYTYTYVTAYDEYGNPISYATGFVPNNSVNFGWSSLAGLGNGNVMVTLDYNRVVGGAGEITQTFSSSSAVTGVTMNWSDSSTSSYGISSISRMRVWKQDNSGNWVLISDRSANGVYGNRLTWAAPAEAGTQVTFQVQASGSSTWTTLGYSSMGSNDMVDVSSLAAGTYNYQLLFTPPGQTVPTAVEGGSFTASSSGGSVANSGVSNGSNPYDPTTDPATLIQTQVAYDAFGDIVAKGVNNGWQENYQYDNAGNLWRTNAKGGSTHVYLYDLAGKLTSDMTSDTIDLSSSSYTNAAQVAALPVGEGAVSATDVYYDKLERAVKQTQPTFNTPNGGLQVMPGTVTTLSATPVSSAITSSMSADWYGSETGYVLNYGSNTVDLGWASLAALGSGNVEVTIDYTQAVGPFNSTNNTASEVTQTFSGAASDTGVTVNWYDSDPNNDGFGIAGINRIRVWKQNSQGTYVLVADTTNGVAALNTPLPTAVGAQPGTTMSVQYQAAGTSSWTTASTTAVSGTTSQFNVAGLANGTYNYQVLYTRPGETTPYADITGTFTVSNGIVTSTQNTTDTQTYRTVAPTQTMTLDRWGNAIAVSNVYDGNEAPASVPTTYYAYNSANQTIEEIQPAVDQWSASGVDTVASPTTYSYYDALGRLVATIDPNGNVSGSRYNAAGEVLAEYHADGGIVSYAYDAFGNQIAKIDANQNVTKLTYDRNNHVTQQQAPIGTISYTYDGLGNRITSTDALNNTTTYYYDLQGHVVRTVMPMGQTTTAVFDDRGNKISQTDANGNTTSWVYNYFGQLQSRVDLGGAVYNYTYDLAGHLLTQTNSRGQNLSYTYYGNGQVKTLTDNAIGAVTTYEYDAAGNRTREYYVENNTVYQDTRTQYDSLGRIASVTDNQYSQTYHYDANGNRREIYSTYYDSNGKLQTIDNWYTYDSMNRVVISQGVLSNGTIGITTTQGISLQYDAAGNRRVATSYQNGSLVTESYDYDQNNRLISTSVGGQLTSARTYDANGNVTQEVSYSGPGVISNIKDIVYNADGWVKTQDVYDGNNNHTQNVTYTGYDNLGNVLGYTVNVYNNTPYMETYQYNYTKLDGYEQKSINGTMSVYYSTGTTTSSGSTTSTYDVNGFLISVTDSQNSANNRTFVNNAQGEALTKTQSAGTQRYFYVNGNSVGSSGVLASANFDYNYTPINDNYPATTPSTYVVAQGDTLQSIAYAMFGDASLWYLIADANGITSNSDLASRVGTTITIPNKITNLHNSSGVYKPYNSNEVIGDRTPTIPVPDAPPPPQPSGGGGCGVLGMIVMIIVAVVVTIFTAGAAAAALGVAGSSIMGVGASVLAGTAGMSAMGGFLVGALAGAVGSAVSQLAGVAMGNVQHFSWGAVAASALTAGLGATGAFTEIGGAVSKAFGSSDLGSFGTDVVNGAVSDVADQGINLLTGQQSQFSWSSLASGAVMGGLSWGASKSSTLSSITHASSFSWKNVAENAGVDFVEGSISEAISNDGVINWKSVEANAFGNALGNGLVLAMRPITALHKTNAPGPAADGTSTSTPPTGTSPGGLGPTSSPSGGSTPTSVDPATNAQDQAQPGFRTIGKDGSSLYGIAQNVLGPDASAADVENYTKLLLAANPNLGDPRTLQVGTTVNLPDSSTTISASAETAYDNSNAQLQASQAEQQAQQQAVDAQLTTDGGNSVLFSPYTTPGAAVYPADLGPLSSDFTAPGPSTSDSSFFGNLLTAVGDLAKQQIGVEETALHIVTGAIGNVVGGWTMILSGGDVGAGRAVQDAFTYTPRTEDGQADLQAISTMLTPVAQKWQSVETTLGNAGYGIGGQTLGPYLGAGATALPDLLLSLTSPEVRGAFSSVGSGVRAAASDMLNTTLTSSIAYNQIGAVSLTGNLSGVFGDGSVANTETSLADVWNLNPTDRGNMIESHLAQTDYKDWFNIGQLDNGYFPLVDFQSGDNLVSLKSVDTTGTGWLGRMQSHIVDLGGSGATVSGNPANMILDLRVQPGGIPAAQPLIQFGRDNGVSVIIKEFK